MNDKQKAAIAKHKADYNRRKNQHWNPVKLIADDYPEHCAQCGKGMYENPSGFCSVECESSYGECPDCGAPSKGNRVCFQCRIGEC